MRKLLPLLIAIFVMFTHLNGEPVAVNPESVSSVHPTPPGYHAGKARGLTKEQIIAHLRAVAENNLRADIRTIERAWKEKPSEGISAKSASN